MKILIAGGTGFLGSQITAKLIERHHDVVLLTRRPVYSQRTSTYQIIHWPLTTEYDLELVKQCDVVVNLAGASIAGSRWSDKRKAILRSSRIQFTHNLVDAIATSPKLKTFLSASAVGFYGDRKSEVLTENSPRGEGFLAKLCQAWEAEANALAGANGVRVVNLRTGAVLARHRGFLREMERIFKLHLGGPTGSGDQFISWIHLQDWLDAILFILEHESLSGPINLVAPEPVSNRAFSFVYREILHKHWQLHAPEIALRVMLGEQSSIVLDSQNARPKVLQDNGFKFKYPSLRQALEQIYSELL